MKETIEAVTAAYFLPTMGFKYLVVISLLYWLMYAFDVVEIFSMSGIRVFWNLIGRSLNSEIRS